MNESVGRTRGETDTKRRHSPKRPKTIATESMPPLIPVSEVRIFYPTVPSEPRAL